MNNHLIKISNGHFFKELSGRQPPIFVVGSNYTKILAGLIRGETAIQEGRVLSNNEAKKHMSKWLG